MSTSFQFLDNHSQFVLLSSSTKYLFGHSYGGNLFLNHFWNREVVLEKEREPHANRPGGGGGNSFEVIKTANQKIGNYL